jgi:diguanylate cyclase (GGDEF)-like protein
MAVPETGSLQSSILFSVLVLFIATAAYLLFIRSLPGQPNLYQRRALKLFSWFFIVEFFAYLVYCLRFVDFYLFSVVFNNVLYLCGVYLFYCGVRSRYQLDITRQVLGWICAHVVGLAAALYWFTAVHNEIFIRLPLALGSFCIPVLITFSLIRQQQRPGNLGDRVLLLCTIVALVLIPLLYPAFGYLLKPDQQGQLMVMTLVTLTLETLCIGGLAISYIYDLIDKLRSDANTDKLTQTSNRRYFFKVAPQYQQRAAAGEQISLVLLDIDHFKQLNDRYGHQAGDAVLRHFAELLRQQLSAADLIVRYGGEEFVLVLAGKTPEQTLQLLTQFQLQLKQAPLVYLDDEIVVRASYGVATLHAGQDIEHCVHRADLALYQAKASGRDTVVLDSLGTTS